MQVMFVNIGRLLSGLRLSTQKFNPRFVRLYTYCRYRTSDIVHTVYCTSELKKKYVRFFATRNLFINTNAILYLNCGEDEKC